MADDPRWFDDGVALYDEATGPTAPDPGEWFDDDLAIEAVVVRVAAEQQAQANAAAAAARAAVRHPAPGGRRGPRPRWEPDDLVRLVDVATSTNDLANRVGLAKADPTLLAEFSRVAGQHHAAVFARNRARRGGQRPGRAA